MLDTKGVYILGKLISSNSEGEIGWVYNYQYEFKNKIFVKNFTGPLSLGIKNDSLMFFRILPDDPEVCRQLQNIRVPKCINLKNMPKNGWEKIPECFSK